MPRYVLLVDWTEQGVQAVDQTVERLEQGTKLGEAFGASSSTCGGPRETTTW